MSKPTAPFLLLALAACAEREPGPRPGDLAVEWHGLEQGAFIAPLAVRHCPESGQVELIAVRGDTAVGAVLFLAAPDTVAPGDYPVVPATVLQEPRPGAAAAIRWFGVTQITGFEGLSGTVRLARDPAGLSGALDVRLQSIERGDSLFLTGRFAGVALVPADSGCGRTMRRNLL